MPEVSDESRNDDSKGYEVQPVWPIVLRQDLTRKVTKKKKNLHRGTILHEICNYVRMSGELSDRRTKEKTKEITGE